MAPLVIHATPPLDPLPASDTESIYLVALAQLICPGRWGLTTGNWSDNGGSLPYVTHLDHRVPAAHLHAVPSLPHPDADLSRQDRAEALTWVAYIDGTVTDLVNHSLYSLPPNYPATISKAHTSNLAFPQSVIIPQRLRGMYKSRLQHVGLWGLGGMNDADLAEEDRKRLDEVFVQAPGGTVAPRAWNGWRAGREFEDRKRQRGEEEIIRKAKDVFTILDRRLDSKPYFFGNRPTSPDLRLFANLSLILETSLPNPLLPDYLKEHHPDLVSHCDRLKWLLFGPDSWSIIPVTPAPPARSFIASLRGSISLPGWMTGKTTMTSSATGSADEKRQKEVNPAEEKLKKGRWMWYVGAAGLMVAYVFGTGLVQIEFGSEDDWEVVGEDGVDVEASEQD